MLEHGKQKLQRKVAECRLLNIWHNLQLAIYIQYVPLIISAQEFTQRYKDGLIVKTPQFRSGGDHDEVILMKKSTARKVEKK